jgi:hypothetical protein
MIYSFDGVRKKSPLKDSELYNCVNSKVISRGWSSKYITAVYQYIVRTPEQLDPDSVCTLNDKISGGDKPPIPGRGETAGDSQLRP